MRPYVIEIRNPKRAGVTYLYGLSFVCDPRVCLGFETRQDALSYIDNIRDQLGLHKDDVLEVVTRQSWNFYSSLTDPYLTLETLEGWKSCAESVWRNS